MSELSFQDRIIAERVPGLTFVDIGGLWGTINEKVSVALRAGAKSAAMADICPLGHEMWTEFDRRISQYGMACERYSANLNDPAIEGIIGRYDFVHCAGVLYHVPSPMETLNRLYRVTRKYLLLGSMIVPEIVETPDGVVPFTGGRMVLIPALDEPTRRILAAHFQALGIEVMHINSQNSQPFKIGNIINFGPWWWLYSASTLAGMLEVTGFKVIDRAPIWDGRAVYMLCEKS